jgi:hypothetical protein
VIIFKIYETDSKFCVAIIETRFVKSGYVYIFSCTGSITVNCLCEKVKRSPRKKVSLVMGWLKPVSMVCQNCRSTRRKLASGMGLTLELVHKKNKDQPARKAWIKKIRRDTGTASF